MVDHICETCNKHFDRHVNFVRHKNRKNPCTKNQSESNKRLSESKKKSFRIQKWSFRI